MVLPTHTSLSAVMPAHSASKTRVYALMVAGIHVFLSASKSWMAGTSPAMTPYRRQSLIVIAIGFLVVLANNASAQQRPNRLEIWDLKLGMAVTDLPDEFTDYACGNNGGPPSTALTGWRDFKRCRPEPGGLREVYFRYDDELEYWAKANQFATEIRKFSGTKVFDFPVVLSARLDDNGILKGIRIVSDPRDTSRDREEAYLLRNFLNARYGREDWDCVDLPAEDGETPVFRTVIKQRCKKTVEGGALAELATSYLRKKGQAEIDPHSGRQTEGQFESLVRFELTLPR
jgi:hypothetical protein